MGSIWGFLLQTLSVSLTAALLLLVKRLLADKLSPRWQYGVWGVLALRVLWPVSLSRFILPSLSLWVETAKAAVERHLASAYTDVYTPITLRHVLPWFEQAPVSLTDWLLVVYAAGVVLCLLRYAWSYSRLRWLLRRSVPAPQVQQQLHAVCEAYRLKPCRVVAVEGLSSAFVCGAIRPILAVPAGQAVDDKVLLHELLHLKHWDVLQGVFWCVLRALHWCNPFLQYVFDRVGNDMESLCDQRVLERLEGEERREYGAILLAMTNQRYARAVGTSSVSNGGKNIARRIAAIVRFKKYPRGMALVSVCMALLLFCPTVLGAASSFDADEYQPTAPRGLERAMAVARVRRCTTLAGALDTYAKGLMLKNGVYLASASPLSRHAALDEEMRRTAAQSNGVAYYVQSGEEFDFADFYDGYKIVDLVEEAAGQYRAMLVISLSYGWDEESETVGKGCVVVPVRVWYEDAWVVEESGERQVLNDDMANFSYYRYPFSYAKRFAATGESGTVTLTQQTEYRVKNIVQVEENGLFGAYFGGDRLDTTPYPDAVFANAQMRFTVEYQCADLEKGPTATVGLRTAQLGDPNARADFSMLGEPRSEVGGGTTSIGDVHTYSWETRGIGKNWDGFMSTVTSGLYVSETKDAMDLPTNYTVQVVWDGQVKEELKLTEVVRE